MTGSMTVLERSIEVGSDGRTIAATIFLPDPAHLGKQTVAVFALPGGGYSRNYFDLRPSTGEGYSQAEFHLDRGRIFVAIDHLGVGDSTTHGLDVMRIEDIADANAAAVASIAGQIRSGALAEGYPQLPRLRLVGVGQSMGGGVTILMQARSACYDAIGVLGYSALHTVLPQRSESARRRGMDGHGRQAGRDADVTALSLAESSKSTEDYVYPFHWEDVLEEFVAADMGTGYPVRRVVPPWGSPTIPNCVIAMMSPGYVKQEAQQIDVPVLIGVGERDVVPELHAEPSAYTGATDVTLVQIPTMAHMHNFASTRRQLWERIEGWIEAVV